MIIMSPERFSVVLNKPGKTYSPGEELSGTIYLELREAKTVRGLKVQIRGKAEVKWTDTAEDGSDEECAGYVGEEVYFLMDFYELGSCDGENIEIEPGSYVFPFSVTLPPNIPSSLETDHGSIRYSVKVLLDRRWKSDCERSIGFTVDTPFDLSQSHEAWIPILDEEHETFCWFPCFIAGAMRVKISLPSSGYAIGEVIQATIKINNMSTTVDAEKIELELIQKLSLYTRHMETVHDDQPFTCPYKRTKILTKVVQQAKKEGPFSKKAKIVVSMEVPSLPYSDMIHCSIIDIAYRLKVTVVVSGCHLNIEKKYPIIIGTRPGSPGHQTPRNSVTSPSPVPTAPFVSDESPMPMPMPTETTPMLVIPEETMPMPMPADTIPMPMPMPMPTPYSPSHGEKITEERSNELDPPAPGFSSTITNPDVVPVHTPYPTGKTPYPTGIKSNPMSNSPYPTDITSSPTSHSSYPTGIISNPMSNSPYPTNNAPYPTGKTPYPVGNTPYPTGNTPYPVDNTPYPTGNTPYPTGNTPYPTGNTPYPTGIMPYPPAKPEPIGFDALTPAQRRFSTEPAAPPSYDEAL